MSTGARNFVDAVPRADDNRLPDGRRRLAILGLVAGATLLLPLSRESLAAQADSATVVAGARYEAGSVESWLLGDDYRDLWTTPIRVPVLDLRTFAGGLRPTELGGGRQTISLRFMGADGREYAFRSVHKQPALAADPDVGGALLGYLIQDQVSSMVPAAPLAAAHLSRSVGLLHAQPTLYVMPDDPALGEFRELMAGMLGTLEERPDEREAGGPGFGGFERIVGTESMLENVEEDIEQRIDSRQFLYARLLDLVMGDWDRHEDQWRWARRDTLGLGVWVPIPRDRDYAFADYDGALLGIVRRAVPNAVPFRDRIDHLKGLTLNGHYLDRQLLADLDRAAWDSVAVRLQSRLTDAVLEEAIRRLPPEYVELEGASLLSRLRSRRDMLPEAAAAFYRRLAAVPTVYTTDEDETATITRHADGSVEVRVDAATETASVTGSPYYRRTFTLPDTREIRIFLRGGDDWAIVRGEGSRGIAVRVIGGGGDDVLVDSSTVATGGRWTSLHDSGEGDRLVGGWGTTIDRRSYEEPEGEAIEGLVRIPDPDAGTAIGLTPSLDYSTTRGAILGVGASVTRFAFRRHPFASRMGLDLRYSTRWSDFALAGRGEFRGADPALVLTTELVGSRIDALRFYGFGNETEILLPSDRYVVRRELLSAEVDVHYSLGDHTTVSGGIVGRHTRPWLVEGSPLLLEAPSGSGGFGSLGVRGGLELRRRPTEPARPAYFLDLDAAAFPVSSRPADPFGSIEADGAVELPLTSAGSTRLSARAGGRYAWGDYPFYEAAFLGGRHTLRGLPEWRLAGDAMVYGGVEAMVPVARLPLFLDWRTAAFVFMDAGRVFLDGEDSDRWHSAPGVGLALSALRYHLRVSYAQGPKGRVYLETSIPF